MTLKKRDNTLYSEFQFDIECGNNYIEGFCLSRSALFPRRNVFVSDAARTARGKIVRRALRKRVVSPH
jgi:acyl-CoA synthetase (AMP-forming)/AMP-acid ligase II